MREWKHKGNITTLTIQTILAKAVSFPSMNGRVLSLNLSSIFNLPPLFMSNSS